MFTPPNIVTDWLNFLKSKNYSENTISSYFFDIKFFIQFIEQEQKKTFSNSVLKDLKIGDFRDYLYSLDSKKELSKSSKSRAVSTVKSFFNFAKKQDLFKNEAINHLKTPKFSKGLPRALNQDSTMISIDEVDRIEYFKRNAEGWVAFRDYILLKLIYSTGLRISEALEIKVGDIKSPFLKVKGKGSKERVIPIMTQVQTEMFELIEVCPFLDKKNIEAYLFLGKRGGKLSPSVFQRTIRNLRNNLNLPEDITPHSFRHSFATHLLNNSSDIRSIQELLGHASLSTTQIYTQVDKKRILSSFSEL